mmetsp:Transcript_207/g.477  ORF Transcript_207/g.477 Transcript_207/m.477 type:complete len:500 (-) Transcript_207:321-1820(-)
MVNLNSRRGAAHHHNYQYITRIFQGFVVFTTSVIIIGYYYFLSSTIPAKINNRSGGGDDGNENDSSGIQRNGIQRNGISRITSGHNGKQPIATIGYAVTVSGCPKDNGSRGDFGAGISDGAAVLKHSIHLNSIQNHQSQSMYDYKMYALVHPEAESCARPALEPLGYEILLRDVPVPLEEIEGKFLREKVPSNGCCGEKEFVKIHAYTLIQHPVVVHLDLDTLVLKPMDRLYDVMINGAPKDGSNGEIDVAFGDPLISSTSSSDSQINAFFTRDYNMAHSGQKHVGAQGGFLVLRPSLDVYDEFVAIIRKGDFHPNKGWGGLGFGPFYGSMTFQGIIPYFYDHLHPGTGVELNPCVYNNMAHNPRDKATKNDIVSGRCRDGYNRPDKHDECEDCRSRPFGDVFTTHFTLCQKPWECLPQSGDRIQERLCRKFHAEWYRVREDLETKMWGRKSVQLTNADEVVKLRGGRYQTEHFRGYCKQHGKNGYIKVDIQSQKLASS